jgi:hypothetical protein
MIGEKGYRSESKNTHKPRPQGLLRTSHKAPPLKGPQHFPIAPFWGPLRNRPSEGTTHSQTTPSTLKNVPPRQGWFKLIILATREVEIRRTMFETSWNKKVVGVWHPSSAGSINRRISVQAGPGIKWNPISKITSEQRAEWLKWWSAFLVSVKPWAQTLLVPGKQKRMSHPKAEEPHTGTHVTILQIWN